IFNRTAVAPPLAVSSPMWRMSEPDHAHGCAQGSCYPATGDLLVGRDRSLVASSTCGSRKKESYCIVSHLQEEKNCFFCDSRRPYDPIYNTINHRVENVITTFKPHRKKSWWQSENGKSDVFLQLDLEAEFHFTHLIMTFKTFRPAAMLIERSADFGRSWQVYRYFAYDCDAEFPGVSQGPLRHVDDLLCESRYSDIEPSTEGEVSPLKITNLRIKEKYYYAMYELVVRGNCFCYGHASECAPIDGIANGMEGMVHGRCVCNHRTKGLNCEQCDDFYNDLPWRPAEGRHAHACKECECNGHSSSCHFDMAVYLATGNSSGGVCDLCQHNTMGRNCESCKPFYYKDPRRDIRDPQVCTACDCDPDGSLNGGMCDAVTDPALGQVAGQCRCKPHVEGPRCDKCKAGFYGLSADNPEGCQPCRCDHRGTVSGGAQCDPVSGDCFCKRLVTGRSCDQCLPEHWALSHDLNGCRGCGCDVGGARDNLCAVDSGQCRCRSHMTGRQCSQVESGFFFAALDHLLYEAELATLGQGCSVEVREHQPGRPASWTGLGFAHVPQSSTLEFTIDNVPFSMEYDLLLRYESPMPRDWEEVQVTLTRPGPIPTSSPCGNTIPDDDRVLLSLPATTRFVVPLKPLCLEKGVSYTLHFDFRRYQDFNSVQSGSHHILVDSMALMPRHSSLDMFGSADPAAALRRQAFERYRCHDTARSVTRPVMSEACAKLISSMSALIYDGALACQCDPQGALSSLCDVRGGQCHCRQNVMGRRCDQCAPGTYGFGPNGCIACGCSADGALSRLCDKFSGQCQCRPGAFGPRCDRCQSGHWGFPNCRPCQCNGHADECEQTASGGQCRPCPCPDGPNSGRPLRASCYQDNRSRPARVRPGYYGNPSVPGGRCQPCECNNNIDMSDRMACDGATGRCLKCLYHTEGPHCDTCQSGYYGDASRRNCRKCSCNSLGTDRGQCPSRDECSCQRSSGAACQVFCPRHGCHVDHCCAQSLEPYAGGCQVLVTATPTNALQRRPQRACDCDWRGIDSPQCHRRTGHCSCRPGVSGVRCDQCARGFSGLFPNCLPCHQCFGDWDRIVQDLAVRTKALVARAHELQTTGLTGPYERAFKDLEEKLSHAMSIVHSRNKTSAAVTVLMGLIEELRMQIADTTDTLNHLEAELTIVQDTNTEASKDLSDVEREARELNLTSQTLHRQLDVLKNSNFLGAYDSIRGSYDGSRNAERRANESTVTKPSVVSESADTRRRTERLISSKKDEFNRKNAANKGAMSVRGPGDAPCGEAPCGGAGCRDDEGRRFCGGLNCNGAVAMADNALERSQHAERDLHKAMGEQSCRTVAEAKARAEEAKGKAQAALDKATATKSKVQRSNDELRDLIKQIRDFLTQDGAEPGSIEAVANRVLELSIPASTLQIGQLADEIKQRVRSLSNVDAILEQTQHDVRKAERLLLDAKRARHGAEGVKTTAEAVKQALADAQTAQTSVEKAINTARADIRATEDRLTQSQTAGGERDLSDATGRLAALGREIDALKTQRAKNSMAAARAEETATMARDKANEAKQILEGQLMDKYHEVQQRVDTKAKAVLDAKGRAEGLREEAKALLQDAQAKLQKLAELEKSYEENQRRLEGKARQLDGLEDKMKVILHDINRQIQIYNTCQ
uniref:Laminin, beta 2 (laminin S) n=1 Tax=Neogobius melanostomus TaxID=47308 RepID=A0A8C6WPG4_9GOBI